MRRTSTFLLGVLVVLALVGSAGGAPLHDERAYVGPSLFACSEEDAPAASACFAVPEGERLVTLHVADAHHLPVRASYVFLGANGLPLAEGLFCKSAELVAPAGSEVLQVRVGGAPTSSCAAPATTGTVEACWMPLLCPPPPALV